MKRGLGGALVFAVLLAAGCGRVNEPGGRQQVRFGMSAVMLSALPIIAVEKGFFAAEGLDVAETDYASGEYALAALLAGGVEVATCSEVPVIAASFNTRDFAVFACIGSSNRGHAIVARRDAGVASLADLRGKRVGTLRHTGMHFFLHLVLLYQGMSERDVQVSFLSETDVVGPLVRGELDAVAVREPYTSEALAQLRGNAVVFEQEGKYTRTQHVVARREFLRQRPETARRVIRALLRAEQWARRHPDAALVVVARRLGVGPDRLAADWAHLRLRVSLEQRLLAQFEEEAAWMMEGGLVQGQRMPNYLEFIETGPLRAVKPGAVTLVHLQ
ncbi:MAG: ABC transporter substrate-binding protein [Verrucomicrobiae bacterium]|nr:ABC transporter substrate-binding protein [Verrucomicrobiae bacterium]